jgi:hypothetical protein
MNITAARKCDTLPCLLRDDRNGDICIRPAKRTNINSIFPSVNCFSISSLYYQLIDSNTGALIQLQWE